GQHAIGVPVQAGGLGLGLLQVAGGDGVDHGLEGGAGLDPLVLLVCLPVLPPEDECQAKPNAGEQAKGVAPQPVADALALFVLVVDIVDRHAVSGPRWRAGCFHSRVPGFAAASRRGLPPACAWLPGQSPAGASEPSEDTVKRATFARWKGSIS